MKIIILIAIIILVNDFANAQTYAWTQKADFPGRDRYETFQFAINGKGYVGTGISSNGSFIYHNDNWEYDPVSNTWVQKSNFPGTPRRGSASFTNGIKGYVCTGWAPAQLNDLWEYNPITDSWLQKANFAGSPRYTAAAFELDGFGYVGMGYNPLTNDFYSYDIANNSWSATANIGGPVRQAAKGFSLNGKGYVVGGGQQGIYYSDELWEYDPSINVWTQKSNFPGNGKDASAVVIINGKALVGGGEDGNFVYQDFYEYDPILNSWTQIQDFAGGPRMQAYYFSIGGCGYVGGGSADQWPNFILKHDLWSLCETTGIENISSDNFDIKIKYVNENKIEFDFSKPIQKELELLIYNITGQTVSKNLLKTGLTDFPVVATNFSKGIYLFKITTGNLIIKTGKINLY
jgi:N-acetylneuraminic acid mutarotase